VSFRVDGRGGLIAFAGAKCSGITIDGRRFIFADRPVEEIAWSPIAVERRVEGGAVFQMQVRGAAEVRIPTPDLKTPPRVVAEGPQPGSRGEPIPCHLVDGALRLTVPASAQGRWLYW